MPFAGQALGERGRQLGIVARQERAGIDHRDRGAEPAMRLRQLDADRPAADHDQMLRQARGWRRSSRWSDRAPRRARGSAATAGVEPVAMTKRRGRIVGVAGAHRAADR